MSGFFDRLMGRTRETPSANKAKERLQFVLVHDRINLPPERLKSMKEEILAVISKYVSVSASEVEIALEQRDRNQNRLIAEIPFSKSIEAPELDDDEKPAPKVEPPQAIVDTAVTLAADTVSSEASTALEKPTGDSDEKKEVATNENSDSDADEEKSSS